MTPVALRSDLVIAPRHDRSGPHYVVEDPRRRKFFRLGPAEYAVLAACDGRRTPAEAAAHAAPLLRSHALSGEEASAVTTWALSAGLALSAVVPAAQDTNAAKAPWNPLCFRVTLGRPEWIVESLLPVARWAWGRGGMAIWLLLWTTALLGLWGERSRIGLGVAELGVPGAMRLLASWCLLKVLHELGHAATCRLFGGDVPHCGLLFLCGIPSPFVDVTSAWRIVNRRQRILVSLAGVYAESFVAAAALIGWAWSSDYAGQPFAGSLAVVAGISTIVCNLNPLLRFDGYFVLSDWWGVPNLAAAGRAAVGRFVHRHFLGRSEADAENAAIGKTHRLGLLLYGLLAAIWRVLMLFGIATFLLTQLGLPLTLLLSSPSLIFAARQIAGRMFQRRQARTSHAPIAYARPLIAWSLLVAAGVGGVAWWNPRLVRIPAVVDFADSGTIRTNVAGFVREIYVDTGDAVTKGQLLCRLENRELESEAVQLKLAIEQSQVRSRMLHLAGHTARAQSESHRRREFTLQLEDLQRRRERFTIRAEIDGIVLTPRLKERIGCRLEPGDEVLSLGNDRAKHWVAAVDETTATAIRSYLQQPAELRRRQSTESVSTRAVLEPSATSALPHPALGVLGGGSLPVRRRETSAAAEQGTQSTVTELTTPHFRLSLPLDSQTAAAYRAGERADICYRTTWRETIARLTARGTQWLGSW